MLVRECEGGVGEGGGDGQGGGAGGCEGEGVGPGGVLGLQVLTSAGMVDGDWVFDGLVEIPPGCVLGFSSYCI